MNHTGHKEAIHELKSFVNYNTVLKKTNIENYKKFISCGTSGNKTYGKRQTVPIGQHTCGFVTGKCCKHFILRRRWSCCPHKEIQGTWFDLDSISCNCCDSGDVVTISRSIGQLLHKHEDLYVVPSSPY